MAVVHPAMEMWPGDWPDTQVKRTINRVYVRGIIRVIYTPDCLSIGEDESEFQPTASRVCFHSKVETGAFSFYLYWAYPSK
jgi:hypothetical protein